MFIEMISDFCISLKEELPSLLDNNGLLPLVPPLIRHEISKFLLINCKYITAINPR